MAKSKITIKYPVFRNDYSHFKRFFILLGPCFPKKGEPRSSWGLELIQDDEGTWQIETNAKYYLEDLGKEKMPRIGSIDLASFLVEKIKELERQQKPHKLLDDFTKMKKCPYHDDWHYCCRCDFENICKWSNNKNKVALKRYIKENWGK